MVGNVSKRSRITDRSLLKKRADVILSFADVEGVRAGAEDRQTVRKLIRWSELFCRACISGHQYPLGPINQLLGHYRGRRVLLHHPPCPLSLEPDFRHPGLRRRNGTAAGQ